MSTVPCTYCGDPAHPGTKKCSDSIMCDNRVLSSRIAELTKELTESKALHDDALRQVVLHSRAAVNAEADVARLRSALETERKHSCSCDFKEDDEDCVSCTRIVAVLAGAGTETLSDRERKTKEALEHMVAQDLRGEPDEGAYMQALARSALAPYTKTKS